MCYRKLTYRLFVWIPILALKEFLPSHLAILKLMWTTPLFKIAFGRKIPLHQRIHLSIQGGSFEIIISLLKMSWNFWSQLLFQSEFQNSCDIWFFTKRNSWKVLKPSFDKFKFVLLTKVNEWLWTSDWKSWLLHLLWIIWFIIWFEEKKYWYKRFISFVHAVN